MGRELAKVESNGLWRGHLRVKGNSPVPSESEYDMFRLHDTGLSYPDIAEHHGITEATAKKAVRKVEKFIESKVAISVADLKVRHHARIEAIIESSLEDYQKSGGKTITTVRKQIPGTNGEDDVVIEETITEKESPRDPKYLTTVLRALADQRSIWPGAVAPSASAIKHETEGEVKISVECVAKLADNLTDEEVAALEKLDKMMDEEDVIDV